MQYGLGPNATTQIASVGPIATLGNLPQYGNALHAEMSKKKTARSRGCRFVKGGACLCNGRFRKKARCRR